MKKGTTLKKLEQGLLCSL